MPAGHDPWAGGEEEEEEEGDSGQVEEGDDLEYDFSSMDKWEGEGEIGEDEGELDYFSTSKGVVEETAKAKRKKRKVISKEKWETDESARTGLTIEVSNNLFSYCCF
jgi:hypothetical protein